jgi:uncharacterized protein (DUF58 family)
MTPHAVGIREYLPSDPMKRIHWPSTARRGRFMVKEFEQPQAKRVVILLDTNLQRVGARDIDINDALCGSAFVNQRNRSGIIHCR